MHRIGDKLFKACRQTNEVEVLRILKKEDGLSVALKYRDIWEDLFGNNVLHQASNYGLTSAVEELISSVEGRGLIKVKNKMGQTPLHFACLHGHVSVVKSLIGTSEGRATITAKDKHGHTALHDAAWKDRVEVLRALLGTAEGQRALRMRNNDGWSPRDEAEKGNHASTVAVFNEFLLKDGTTEPGNKDDASHAPILVEVFNE